MRRGRRRVASLLLRLLAVALLAILAVALHCFMVLLPSGIGRDRGGKPAPEGSRRAAAAAAAGPSCTRRQHALAWCEKVRRLRLRATVIVSVAGTAAVIATALLNRAMPRNIELQSTSVTARTSRNAAAAGVRPRGGCSGRGRMCLRGRRTLLVSKMRAAVHIIRDERADALAGARPPPAGSLMVVASLVHPQAASGHATVASVPLPSVVVGTMSHGQARGKPTA